MHNFSQTEPQKVGALASWQPSGHGHEPAETRQPGSSWKRAFDIVVSVIALVFFAPLFVLVAAAILVADGRPLFFVQRRIGRNGVPFSCLKFRTMRREAEALLASHLLSDPMAAAEWARHSKLKHDPRVLPLVGVILRKSSLDELPQFLNVLRGEMSVVGPRPICEDERAFYEGYFAYYTAMLPGITGLWQVSGRSNMTFAERVQLDVQYCRNRSMLLDCRILLRTVAVVLLLHGAY